MVDVGTGFLTIVPKTEQFVKTLQTNIGKTLSAVGIQTTTTAQKVAAGAQLAFVGLGVAAVAAIGKGISATTDWAGEVRSLQRVTGQTAESASGLAGAGAALGISTQQLSIGFGLLAKNIVNSSENLTKYGIATKDAEGNVLPFDEVLGNVSDKFAELPAGPEQAAFAMNVFGRSGKALIPILQRGSAGLADLEAAAKDAGLVMSQDTLDAAKELSVAQRELGEAFKGAAIRLGTAFLPVMKVLTEALTNVVELVQQIPAPVLSIATSFVAVGAAVLVGVKAFQLLNTALQTTKLNSLAAGTAIGEFAVVLADLSRGSQANALVQQVQNDLLADAKEKYDQGLISAEDYQKVLFDVNTANGKVSASTRHQALALFDLGKQIAENNGLLPTLTGSTEDAAKAAEAHARALQDEHNALTIAAGGLLALATALQQERDDQKSVNDLQRQGKTNTEAYREAVRQLISDHIAFRGALQGVTQDLRQGDITLADAKRQLLNYGQQAGLTKDQVRDAMGIIKSSIQSIPKKITTTVVADTSQATASLASLQSKLAGLQARYSFSVTETVPHHAAGGIVTRPELALIGEAGPEAVIPLSKMGSVSQPMGPSREPTRIVGTLRIADWRQGLVDLDGELAWEDLARTS